MFNVLREMLRCFRPFFLQTITDERASGGFGSSTYVYYPHDELLRKYFLLLLVESARR